MKPGLRSLAAILVAMLAITDLTSCNKSTTDKEAPERTAHTEATATHAELAVRWAPVHYQDTDVTGTYSLSGKSDYLCAVNFDNDWVATNNWNNAANYPANAHAYYSVVETSTHWFITYGFFHARDWTDNPFGYYLDQHENDMEGLMAVIQKDGSTYGTLQGMVTTVHSDFYSFVPSGSPLQANQETIDGTLSMESYNGEMHPVTAQEAKGHALKAWPYFGIVGDGIKYFPSATVTEQPSSADDRDVKYKLVDVFESGGLWDQRNNTQLFSSAGGGFLSTVGSGGANAPWAWDDGNDGSVLGGELATDPAHVTNVYFKNLGSFSLTYTSNKYKGIN